MNFTIDRDKFKTETGKKLYDMLKKIWNNEHFLIGVLATVKGDEKRQKLIDFIEEENEMDSDVITLASLDIAEGIEI